MCYSKFHQHDLLTHTLYIGHPMRNKMVEMEKEIMPCMIEGTGEEDPQ